MRHSLSLAQALSCDKEGHVLLALPLQEPAFLLPPRGRQDSSALGVTTHKGSPHPWGSSPVLNHQAGLVYGPRPCWPFHSAEKGEASFSFIRSFVNLGLSGFLSSKDVAEIMVCTGTLCTAETEKPLRGCRVKPDLSKLRCPVEVGNAP